MPGSIRNNGSAYGSRGGMSYSTFTDCGWFRAGPTMYTTGDRYQFWREIKSGSTLLMQLLTDGNPDTIIFYTDHSPGEITVVTGASTHWYYGRFVKNGTAYQFDVSPLGSDTWTTVAAWTASGDIDFVSSFRSQNEGGVPVDGYKRSWRSWNVAKSQADCLLEKKSRVPVDTTNLVMNVGDGDPPAGPTWYVSNSGNNLTPTGTAQLSGDEPIPDGVRIMPIPTFRVREFENPPTSTSGNAPLVAPAGSGLVLGANKPGVPLPLLMQRVTDGDAAFDVGLLEGKSGGYKFGLGATAPNVLTGPPATATGTPVAATYAPANVGQKHWRVRYPTTAGAGTLGGWRADALFLSAGNSIGFLYRCRFVLNEPAAVSGARAFVGLTNSTAAPTNVDPASLTNAIGVARLSADNTQLYLIASGSSAQSGVALGTGFPPFTGAANDTNGVPYELLIYASPNNDMYWSLRRLDTLAMTSGQLTGTAGTQRPAANTALAPRGWCTNNATAAATALEAIDSSWLRLAA